MIHGKKVTIKSVSKEDSWLIYEWVNKEELRDLTGTLYPISEYEHEKWIESIMLNGDRRLFSIYLKDKCIGTIGLKNFDYVNRNAELFISIGDDCVLNGKAGTGVGTDAVGTMVDYCFTHLNFHKIYLHVYETNLRAIRCYEKVGFEKEGILREHHFSKGRYENVIVMGKVCSI